MFDELKTTSDFTNRAAIFILHLMAATWGSIFLGSQLVDVDRYHRHHSLFFALLVTVPWTPVVWGSGFWLGWIVTRNARDRSALFAGPFVALVIAVFLIGGYSSYQHSRWDRDRTNNAYLTFVHEQMFSLDYTDRSESWFGRVFFAGPLFSSDAYSLAAFWVLRRQYPALRVDKSPSHK